MNILRELESRFCINTDRRELSQAYLRVFIFIGCMVYCFTNYDTRYLQAITFLAFMATLFWVVVAWRKPWPDRVRHIGALVYDCAILGLVMVGFGSGMMGMFAVLLWVSIGYGLRYRSPLYLKLGMLLTSTTFAVSALVTAWHDWGVFFALLLTLAIIPAAMLRPVTELIEANRVKTRFISDVSHDLLTPVSSIIGYCQLSPPSIDGIRINAYQLARQVRAILGRSSKEDLAYEEPSEPFVPVDLLRQIAMIAKPLADSRGIRVDVVQQGALGVFDGPYLALSICLMNLVNNAVKHSGGSVVTLSVNVEMGGLVFEVTDNGKGIAPALQQRIFHRFERGTAQPDTEGLGLGLSIVKGTVVKLGGSIELDSTEHGSVFRLHVPVTPTERPAAPSVVVASTLAPAMTESTAVLFVDDESQSRYAWSSVLREAGYGVHSAASGADALAAIDAGNRYDLCVLDYRMPGMNGLELATAIRVRQPTMRLIAISADNPLTFTAALENHLLDAALQKPLHPAALLSLVDQLRPAQRTPNLQPTVESL